jgi:hypothetical protein
MTTRNTTNTTTTKTRTANMTTRTTRTPNTTMANTTTTITTTSTTTTTTTKMTMTTTTNTMTVTATAVGGDDNGCNSDGQGHRQQSTKIGSKDTVAVATAMETQPRAQQQLLRHANDCPGRWRRWNRLRQRLGGLWVLVVTVVCGVVHAGCVCAARPSCFVRGSFTRTSASKIWQTTAYWGSPESS